MGLLRFLKNLFVPPTHVETPPEHQRDYSVPRSLGTQPSTGGTGGDRADRASPLSGLDTDKFKPLSTEEALDATKGSGWRSAYFDSLSVIPPADLPRIRVIDRTMVGMGLISEEELTHIHQVGREMAKYRSDQGQIEAAAEAAVAQSRQERQRIKEQKKREAADRRKARDAETQTRRANDIVFLGRGVSKGLADRRSNVERLKSLALPVLANPKDVADAMEMSVPRLRWLAFHTRAATRTHYVSFEIPKKSGGVRRISRPHQSLANAQRWILDHVLSKVPVHTSAHGFVPGRSIVTNAKVHVGTDIVVNVDLQDFFPSIHSHRVEGLYRSFGYSPAVATILALICTEANRHAVRFGKDTYQVAVGKPLLPQGACTSPAISNLISRHLDDRLDGLANKLGWKFTRYADDLTFSSRQSSAHEKEKQIGYLLASVRHICKSEGFFLNDQKTRVLRRHSRQVVTGLTVNDRLHVSRKTIRRIRAILHRAQFEGLEAQNKEQHPNFQAWLSGMIAFIESVDVVRGRKMRAELERLV